MYYSVIDDYWVIITIVYYYTLNDYQADDLIDVDEINLYIYIYLSFIFLFFFHIDHRMKQHVVAIRLALIYC